MAKLQHAPASQPSMWQNPHVSQVYSGWHSWHPMQSQSISLPHLSHFI
ncbi:hypothetical protein GJI78_12035 [Lactococcus lactis subsp. cremoris]|nr:hypothetical protein [Lactococcus lactis]MRM77166.1 hypothetical protein [Lactococcus cremoris]MDM7520103.1 hypothetical protein [Lactococcus lactis]MRK41118.1 hypothetical protein [Lactococcus lactis subsp. lactis]MRK42946.1 hypothetical protein [Lactococcus lactis subsp. lactis]MRL48386.1 hypothetical protein [Lactococcus lactis subsp. lactis]